MRLREIAIIALAVFLVLWVMRIDTERLGILNQRIKARETVIASLAKQKARVDTVAGKARVVYEKQRSRYDLAPAVVIHDTVWIPKATADSTVHACSAALETCEHRVAIRDSLILQKDSLILDLRKRHSPLIGCSLGVAVTPKGFGPGVGCGIKVF